MLHVVAIILLIYRIRKSRNCIGLSCKTQEVYLAVFLLRYMDIFWNFVSVYNSVMKIFFISSTFIIIYAMRYKKPYCLTYDQLGDDFPHFKALIPAAMVLTLICNTTYQTKDHSPFTNFKWWFELQWSLSLWLEAVAFIPQIVMLNKIRIVENITSHYVAALGMYRFFYILNWIYRYQVDGKYCLTQILSGCLQTGFYCDFLYRYYIAIKEGKSVIELPL